MMSSSAEGSSWGVSHVDIIHGDDTRGIGRVGQLNEMVRPEEMRCDEIELSWYLSCCDQICEHDPSSCGRRLQTNRDAEYPRCKDSGISALSRPSQAQRARMWQFGRSSQVG